MYDSEPTHVVDTIQRLSRWLTEDAPTKQGAFALLLFGFLFFLSNWYWHVVKSIEDMLTRDRILPRNPLMTGWMALLGSVVISTIGVVFFGLTSIRHLIERSKQLELLGWKDWITVFGYGYLLMAALWGICVHYRMVYLVLAEGARLRSTMQIFGQYCEHVDLACRQELSKTAIADIAPSRLRSPMQRRRWPFGIGLAPCYLTLLVIGWPASPAIRDGPQSALAPTWCVAPVLALGAFFAPWWIYREEWKILGSALMFMIFAMFGVGVYAVGFLDDLLIIRHYYHRIVTDPDPGDPWALMPPKVKK